MGDGYKSEVVGTRNFMSGGREVDVTVTLADGRSATETSGNAVSRGNADHATQKAAEAAKSK